MEKQEKKDITWSEMTIQMTAAEKIKSVVQNLGTFEEMIEQVRFEAYQNLLETAAQSPEIIPQICMLKGQVIHRLFGSIDHFVLAVAEEIEQMNEPKKESQQLKTGRETFISTQSDRINRLVDWIRFCINHKDWKCSEKDIICKIENGPTSEHEYSFFEIWEGGTLKTKVEDMLWIQHVCRCRITLLDQCSGANITW